MKPFSLEEYLNNPRKEIVTRDGHSVRIICTDREGTSTPIVALVTDDYGVERIVDYRKNGRYFAQEAIDESKSTTDLFFASEEHKGWINIYRTCDNGYRGNAIFPTEQIAKDNRSANGVATIEITWCE